MTLTRKHFIAGSLAAACLATLGGPAQAQGTGKLKVGLMLPYTGTFAALGTAIENGFRLHVNEQGGKLGGREIEFVKCWSAPCTRAWRWRWPRRPRTRARC
jgi:branched-chain amino acid transport system substrate-binding protein